MNLKKHLLPAIVFITVFLFGGCAAMTTAIRYKDLEVETQMSHTIFLDPAPPEKKTVWVEVRDTSGEGLNLAPLTSLLASRGYRVVNDPNSANYRMQVNVRYMGKASIPSIKETVHAGFGGPLVGIAGGAIIGDAVSDRPLAPLAGAGVGGLLGLGAEWIAGELVKKVTFATVVDIQLSEFSSAPVREQQTANLARGGETKVYQSVDGTSNWKRYTTRIASSATQVNLDLETAKPAMINKLAQSIAGML